MSDVGIQRKITALLNSTNTLAGYFVSLVCTEQGLLVASSGDLVDSEMLAGVTSLFDDIVVRGERDLGLDRVDEVTVLDPGHGRLIVRPLPGEGSPRFFLVVRAPAKATWRRNTNQLCKHIAPLLSPLAGVGT